MLTPTTPPPLDLADTAALPQYPPTAYGAFQRLRTWLFGPIQHRLAEEPGEIHPLSYLLIAAQSLTVLFVFAHQQIVQMLTATWTIKVIAGLVSFVLVITVIAADMCVAYSWRRIPPLRRNREDGMVWEHWLYILFVLALEGTTFAVVIATLENTPDALLSAHPVIDAGTWLWRVMVAARLVTVGWTTLQLLIVKSKVPVQWTTLMGTGAEVLGGHAQHLMQNLNVQGHDLARVVNAYAALTKPRRRFPTNWNRAKVAKEVWHEQRENQQREEVLTALREFEPHAAVRITETPPTPPNGPEAPPRRNHRAESPALPDSAPSVRLTALPTSASRNQQREARAPFESDEDWQLYLQVAALLDDDPKLSRRRLREKLNVRQERINHAYTKWQLSRNGWQTDPQLAAVSGATGA